MKILTEEDILSSSTTVVPLPARTEEASEPVGLTIRRISDPEWWATLPRPVPGSEGWSDEIRAAVGDDTKAFEAEWIRREQAWLDTLTPEEYHARRLDVESYPYRVTAVAAGISERAARQLANDARVVEDAVLQFSRLGKYKTKAAGAA